MYFGLRAHLRICWPGVIVGLQLAPANIHDLQIAETLLQGASGWALADRNYWSPDLIQRLPLYQGEGLTLERRLKWHSSEKSEKKLGLRLR